MKAFHGDGKIKEKYLARVRLHREADELVKGQYWENGKGCAVGCTIHGAEHERYEMELGIPQSLARLEDGIFEGLPNGKAMGWPEEFLEAIAVGADLSLVIWQFLHWLLTEREGVVKFASEEGKRVMGQVANLLDRKIRGEVVEGAEWDEAHNAAAKVRRGCWAAAAWRAAAAAAAAWRAAAAAAAAENARVRQGERLIELLRAAPVAA